MGMGRAAKQALLGRLAAFASPASRRPGPPK
jgi:hypothetical protein